jgi:hypothetical protein
MRVEKEFRPEWWEVAEAADKARRGHDRAAGDYRHPDRSHTALNDMHAVIDFEAEGLTGGNQEAAVRERFGVSFARYHQALHRILQTQEALEYNPMVVNRLRATHETKRADRASRGFRTS